MDLDIQTACGALQVCASREGGCEAAVHAMQQLFYDPGCQVTLLLDASNILLLIIRLPYTHLDFVHYLLES